MTQMTECALPNIIIRDLELSPIPPTCLIRRLGPDCIPQIIEDAKSENDICNLFMRMFYIYGAYGLDKDALLMQDKALELRKCFRINAPKEPEIRLLSLVAAGEMTDNTPLDFVVEKTNIQLEVMYVNEKQPDILVVPLHDIIFVGLGESTKNNPILDYLDFVLKKWPRPVINYPLNVKKCGRVQLYNTLCNVDGIHIAKTKVVCSTDVFFNDEVFVIRPVGTHSGKGFQLITSRKELNIYLSGYHLKQDFYVSDYVDYKSSDGYFRKYRIVLIGGEPFVCHLAISEHWVVNYIGARMDLSEAKRNEEKLEMLDFEFRFGLKHKSAFRSFHEHIDLDYVVLDCFETKDNKLLIFEADPGSWIHATDPVELYPYKQPVMQKAFNAFTQLLKKKIEKFLES